MVHLPPLIGDDVFFYDQQAKPDHQGIVDLAKSQDIIGYSVKGAEDIEDGKQDAAEGPVGDLAVFSLQIIRDHGGQELDIFYDAIENIELE